MLPIAWPRQGTSPQKQEHHLDAAKLDAAKGRGCTGWPWLPYTLRTRLAARLGWLQRYARPGRTARPKRSIFQAIGRECRH